jgi:hypothetical protein
MNNKLPTNGRDDAATTEHTVTFEVDPQLGVDLVALPSTASRCAWTPPRAASGRSCWDEVARLLRDLLVMSRPHFWFLSIVAIH